MVNSSFILPNEQRGGRPGPVSVLVAVAWTCKFWIEPTLETKSGMGIRTGDPNE